ncbi:MULTISPECIES: signal peptidase II [unclassified Sporosarcina]|uniref:signal peptidase II n=1 Tax=unclassified Sporosarcina TaxID=2647733 RepID=UPI000C171C99|nr:MULTISPECIES: signal peptidase II [unclassified Sporosarcina]PID02725.1 signal peptidase II [Sporosarcina sp. P2]PID25510.1 signal peptidase II [Sporosarcina sp. P7]
MIVYYAIAALVIGLDQLTKWLVVKNMELGEYISVLDPYIALLSHRNRGAAWGMLEGKMWLFFIVTIVVVVAIVYFFHTEGKKDRLLGMSLMLLLGGAIGNFIDRLVRGEVVDFISVLIPVIHYDFPIFNVADAALTIAVILILLHVILDEKKKKKKVS